MNKAREELSGLDGATVYPYKNLNDTRLNVYHFAPDIDTGINGMAIVFFFGGGWISGKPAQFAPQARELAARGVNAFCAEYRIQSVHGTSPLEAVRDGIDAIRWVRAHATEFGYRADKIVASGGSAGGHIAACTALAEDMAEEGGAYTNVSSVPNALILYNPVLDTGPSGFGRHQFGEEALSLSPYHRLSRTTKVPPTLIMHGTGDTTVHVSQAEMFYESMLQRESHCELIRYLDMEHGFFNYGKHDNRYYQETLKETFSFLVRNRFIVE